MEEGNKVNGGKVENCKEIKDQTWRMAMGEYYVQKTWEEYLEDLYNMNIEWWASIFGREVTKGAVILRVSL